MDPALETVMQALMNVVVAKSAGRVTKGECVQVVAAALLAFEVTRDELYAQVAVLAQAQAVRTIDRLLAESNARRPALCAPAASALRSRASSNAPVEDPPTRPLRLVPPGAVPTAEIHDESTVCARCRRRATECICK